MIRKENNWSRCDWGFMHAGATAVTVLVLYVIALHWQDVWDPFDKVIESKAEIIDNRFHIERRILVHRRYKVGFTSRVIHMPTGDATPVRTHGPTTGRVGEFDLKDRPFELLDPPRSGEWCLFTEGTVHYNFFLSEVPRSYEPVCAVAR